MVLFAGDVGLNTYFLLYANYVLPCLLPNVFTVFATVFSKHPKKSTVENRWFNAKADFATYPPTSKKVKPKDKPYK